MVYYISPPYREVAFVAQRAPITISGWTDGEFPLTSNRRQSDTSSPDEDERWPVAGCKPVQRWQQSGNSVSEHVSVEVIFAPEVFVVSERRGANWVIVVLLAAFGACCRGQDDGGRLPSPAAAGDARAIVAALKARAGSPLQAGLAERFEIAAGRLRPQFSTTTTAAAEKAGLARVTLPANAGAPLHLEDAASGTSVDVTLKDARPVAAQTTDGYVVYRGGHASGANGPSARAADRHRGLRRVRHEARHRRRSPTTFRWAGGAAGLRLVGGTLEVLDAGGAPRLRVAAALHRRRRRRAHGRDAGGRGLRGRHQSGGALGPRGDAAGRDELHASRVTWPDAGVVYPAMLDPRWTTTGSMATARQDHTADRCSRPGRCWSPAAAARTGDDRRSRPRSSTTRRPGPGRRPAA